MTISDLNNSGKQIKETVISVLHFLDHSLNKFRGLEGTMESKEYENLSYYVKESNSSISNNLNVECKI